MDSDIVARLKCAECGEEFILPANEARGRLKASKSGKMFCSHSCGATNQQRMARESKSKDYTCAYCGKVHHVMLTKNNTGVDVDGNKVFLCKYRCRIGMVFKVRRAKRILWVAETIASGHTPCNRCGVDKPLDMFPKRNGETKPWLLPCNSVCKSCKSLNDRAPRTSKAPVEYAQTIPLPSGELPTIDNCDHTPLPGPGDDQRVLESKQVDDYKWHCRVCGLAHTAYDDARDCCSRGGYYPPEKMRLMPWRRDGKSGEQACAQATEAGA